ncbi:MAG: transglutaminase domain protein [Deltaproteobacteria bacterium]|nr:transglutaminase domain protein [Deltaproteobacteria bacterium]
MVAVWLILMALLVHRTHFSGHKTESGGDTPNPSLEAQDKEWREIYLKDRKVGYTVSLIRPFKTGYFIQEELFLKLNLMGLSRNLYSLTQVQVDEKLLLRSFQLMMNSGVVRFRMSGKVEGDVLVLSSGGQSTKRIKLAQTPMLSSTMGYFFRSRKVKVGDVFHFPFFDPSTLIQKELLIKVTGKQTLTLHRVTYETFCMETELWGKRVTFWVDENGETLKEEGFMGFTTVKSSAARAPQDIEGGSDLYEMTAVAPDRPLKNPLQLTYLKVRMEGVDNDNRRPTPLGNTISRPSGKGSWSRSSTSRAGTRTSWRPRSGSQETTATPSLWPRNSSNGFTAMSTRSRSSLSRVLWRCCEPRQGTAMNMRPFSPLFSEQRRSLPGSA